MRRRSTPRRSGARRVRRWLLVGLATAVVLLAGVTIFQRALIYLPGPEPAPAAADVIPGALDVTLRTADGLSLGAWYVPGRGDRRHTTVLVANGNAGNRSVRAPIAESLRREGFDVLLFDYRGYGGNPGHPDEPGVVEDARSARRWLTDERGVPADRVVYLGESLGAAVLTRLAVEAPPAALVLRSPFSDLASVAEIHFPLLPVRALLAERYPVADDARRVSVPTTVVYGTGDRMTPPAQSLAVARAAQARVVAVPGADHNDPRFNGGPELTGAVVEAAGRAGV